MLFVYKIRNSQFPKHLPGINTVSRKISGDHRKIAIPKSSGTHQHPHPSGNLFHLLSGRCRRKDLNLLLLLFILGFSITKHMPFQKLKRRLSGKPALFSFLNQNVFRYFHALFCRRLHQSFHHQPAHMKQILRTLQPFPWNFLIQCHRDPYGFCKFENFSHNFIL